MYKQTESYVAAVFNDSDYAYDIVKDIIQKDFPMDQLSILQKAGGHGDDFLGISYSDEKERFKVWGTGGALWGSLGGLLASVVGLFVIPGIGSVFIVGPLINSVTGAAVGAGLMTAGAAITHLTIAMRRLGFPEDKLNLLHQAVMDGKTVLLMHCGIKDPEVWRQHLVSKRAGPVIIMP